MEIGVQKWFSKLERSWKRLCEDYARGEFCPISENDIVCYLYYSLIAHEKIAKNYIHTNYPVKIEGMQVDIFLGKNLPRREIKSKPLLVEIKFRKRRLDYYLDHYRFKPTERVFFGDDVEKLIKLRSAGSGVAAVFFQKLPPSSSCREKCDNVTLQQWVELESLMKELEDKLKNEQIRLLYGPRLAREHDI